MEEGAAGAAEACSAECEGSEMPSCSTSGRDNDAESPAEGGTAVTESASPLKPSIKAAAKRNKGKKNINISVLIRAAQTALSMNLPASWRGFAK